MHSRFFSTRFIFCIVVVAIVHIVVVVGLLRLFRPPGNSTDKSSSAAALAEEAPAQTKDFRIVDPDTPIPAIGGDSVFHTVKSGESFWAIARKYDVPVKELLAVNGYDDGSVLRIGERLQIPQD